MLHSEIPAALDKLTATLKHVIATIEWQKFHFAEMKKWNLLAFRLEDHAREQVMDLAAASPPVNP